MTLPREIGDYKIVKRFAWWPVKIQNSIIWLCWYKKYYEWQQMEVIKYYENKRFARRVTIETWELVGESIINEKRGRLH